MCSGSQLNSEQIGSEDISTSKLALFRVAYGVPYQSDPYCNISFTALATVKTLLNYIGEAVPDLGLEEN